MKAKIISGELAGIEFELSSETISSIKEEARIPERINVGQVFQVGDSKYMIVAVGECGVGLTSVGLYPGCYGVTFGLMSKPELRVKLIAKTSVKYLGRFKDIFTEKQND